MQGYCINNLAGTIINSLTNSRMAQTALGAACLTGLYYGWLGKPLKITPTLDNLNIVTFTPDVEKSSPKTSSIDEICKSIQNGTFSDTSMELTELPNNKIAVSAGVPSGNAKTIIINVSGFAGSSGNARYKYVGAGAYATCNNLKNGIIHAPCVSFDGTTNFRRSFNFAQTMDQECLDVVYQQVLKMNPEASIVMIGSCKGATTILNYLVAYHQNPKLNNLKAIILESPSVCLEDLTDQVAKNHVPSMLQWSLPYIFKAWFPAYVWNQKTILTIPSENIPTDIPIFIGSLEHDKVANPKNAEDIANKLAEVCKNVYLFKSTNRALTHGKIGQDKRYQQAVNAFLKKNNLPHNPERSEAGEESLEKLIIS